MCDELGIVERIDGMIAQAEEKRTVSLGTAVKAMMLNGLGFVNRALYLTPQFFRDKPLERLLGEGIPTARWVFQFFAEVHLLVIIQLQVVVLNLNRHYRF